MLLQAAIIALAEQCAPNVNSHTMAALIASESNGNPFAIGVVGAQLDKQPSNRKEAIEVAQALMASGANFSVGLGQVNKSNFQRYGLTLEKAFDACPNVTVSGQILGECYQRAATQLGEGQEALKAALSCYYSNNFTRGFVNEGEGKGSYVMRVAANSERLKGVPRIEFKPSDVKEVISGDKRSIEKPVKVTAIKNFDNEPAERKPDEAESSQSWDVLNDFHQ